LPLDMQPVYILLPTLNSTSGACPVCALIGAGAAHVVSVGKQTLIDNKSLGSALTSRESLGAAVGGAIVGGTLGFGTAFVATTTLAGTTAVVGGDWRLVPHSLPLLLSQRSLGLLGPESWSR